MNQIFNKKAQKEIRQALRRSLPPSEIILWSKLRNRQICDQKFRRQFSVGPYVIDFYCPALKLAIEVDGDSHFQNGQQGNDKRRQAYIESTGIHFLRFRNNEVRENIAGVLESIYRRLIELKGAVGPPAAESAAFPLPRGTKEY
jgi:very-short-patch-repair endonuclease